MKNTGLIEVSESSHVFRLLKFWRIHLLCVIDIHGDGLYIIYIGGGKRNVENVKMGYSRISIPLRREPLP